MSYYYLPEYEFTDHGIQRCRERLGLKGLSDFSVREKVRELIKKSTHQFSDNTMLYIQARENSNLFFIVTKEQRLIITCSPISLEKQMNLEEVDYEE